MGQAAVGGKDGYTIVALASENDSEEGQVGDVSRQARPQHFACFEFADAVRDL